MHSSFYTEAISAITNLKLKKKISDPRSEKIFYNSTFLANNKVLIPTESTERNNIYTYGQLQDEVHKRQVHQPYNTVASALYDKLTFTDITEKLIYYSKITEITTIWQNG